MRGSNVRFFRGVIDLKFGFNQNKVSIFTDQDYKKIIKINNLVSFD